MTAWNLLTLLFSLAVEWQSYYDAAESGSAVRSLMLYVLQGLKAFHNCELAPTYGRFPFEDSVCELFRGWLQ